MCVFPNINYVPNFVPLENGDQETLPKSPRQMFSYVRRYGHVSDNFLDGISNMWNLEQCINGAIADYSNEGNNLERIFHLIEIWGGSAGRFFYFKNQPFNWGVIAPLYNIFVNACLDIHDTTPDSRQRVYNACCDFKTGLNNIGYKYMGVAYITKHARFWLYRNLGENTLPIYDSTFSQNLTMEGNVATFNYLLRYWEYMINQAAAVNVSLLALERQLFNYYQNN